MTFLLLTLVPLVASGLAWLRATRLTTGRWGVDVPLAWFVGGTAFATLCAGLRLGLGVPYTRWTALAVLALPFVLAALRRGGEPCGGGAAEEPRPEGGRASWLLVPLVAWVVVATAATVLHGFETPTQTDDGVRVRALTPVLALADAWGPEARALVPVAGTVPTWVPSLAWRLSGSLDAFHVNYAILTGLVALLALVVGLGRARGETLRGWAQAFAVTSLPLFLYHCTTTYTDAVLALQVGAAFAFLLELERTRDPRDAARALVLLLGAAFVKREGATVALCVALPVLALLLLRARAEGGPRPWRRLAWLRLAWLGLLLVPLAVDAAAQIRAAGLREAFPVVKILLWATEAGDAPASEAGIPDVRARALASLAPALFRSGNAGMLYWALAATLLVRGRALVRSHAASLAGLALLLGLWALGSVWLVPEYSVDQTTIHRALLAVSVPAALWLAAALVGRGAAESG